MFFKATLIFNLGFITVILIADFTDNLRKYSNNDEFNTLLVALLSLYKLPELLISLSPFIFLFSSLYTIRILTLRREIEIFKAAGLSIWQILKPFVLLSLLWGLFLMIGMSTLSIVFINNTNNLKQRILQNTNPITYGENNIWILDSTKSSSNSQKIIRASKIITEDNKTILMETSLFEFVNNRPIKIHYAQYGTVKNNKLIMEHVISKEIDFPMVIKRDLLEVDINIKNNQINDISASPNTIYLWNLPKTINNLKGIGLEYKSYLIYFYELLVLPLFLLSMTLIATSFALSNIRKGKNINIILYTILTGFFIYFITNLINAFGLHGALPPFVSVIIGKIIILLFAVKLIFKKEGL